MKMYPIKGSKYDGKQEWVELSKSKGSAGKQLLTFSDGTKAHIRDEDINKFFELKSEPKPISSKPKNTSKPKVN